MDIIKITNSVVSVGASKQVIEDLRTEIGGFDIANATPMSCMDFLREIKKKYYHESSHGVGAAGI